MGKNIGMIRKLDELGRIVIPMEIRTQLGWKIRDALEIAVQGRKITLQKHEEECIFCSNNKSKELINHKGRLICCKCINSVKNIEI